LTKFCYNWILLLIKYKNLDFDDIDMELFEDLIEELSLLLQNYNLNITLQNKSNWFNGENDLLSLWLNVDVVLIVDIVDVATVEVVVIVIVIVDVAMVVTNLDVVVVIVGIVVVIVDVSTMVVTIVDVIIVLVIVVLSGIVSEKSIEFDSCFFFFK